MTPVVYNNIYKETKTINLFSSELWRMQENKKQLSFIQDGSNQIYSCSDDTKQCCASLFHLLRFMPTGMVEIPITDLPHRYRHLHPFSIQRLLKSQLFSQCERAGDGGKVTVSVFVQYLIDTFEIQLRLAEHTWSAFI